MSKEKELIVRWIRKWGGATSDAVLDPQTEYHFDEEIEGFIGYRLIHDCVIVFGDPVCSKDNWHRMVGGFHRKYSKQTKSILYFIASEAFVKWALDRYCSSMLQFGAELFLDPRHDPRDNQGTHGSLVRRKVRHAQKEGVSIKEHRGENLTVQGEMEQFVDAWMKTRSGLQIHISHVHLFDDSFGKRWFVAHHQGHIVGIIVINRLESRDGWLLNHLMTSPQAPRGTPELLVITALETIGKEGVSFATFGTVPEEKLGQIIGLNQPSILLVRFIYPFIYQLFHLKGLSDFWGKFNPRSEPSYLLFSRPKIGWKEIEAIMQATNISIF